MPAVVAYTADLAESRIAELAELLIDAVESGASVGFMPPLGEAEAVVYWRTVISAMREGTRILLVAEEHDQVQGSVPRP